MQTRLTLRNLDLARKLVLGNAKTLIEEAEILFKNKKYARSFVLSHLAGEEMAKVFIIVGLVPSILKGEQIDMKKFARRFKSHPEKLWGIELFDFGHSRDLDFDWKGKAKEIAEQNLLKNLGLYVHFEGGAFCSPAQLFKRKLARETLTLAKNRYESLKVQEGLYKLTHLNKMKGRYLKLLSILEPN